MNELIKILTISTAILISALVLSQITQSETEKHDQMKAADTSCSESRAIFHTDEGKQLFIQCLARINNITFASDEPKHIESLVLEDNQLVWRLSQLVEASKHKYVTHVWHVDQQHLIAIKQEDEILLVD